MFQTNTVSTVVTWTSTKSCPNAESRVLLYLLFQSSIPTARMASVMWAMWGAMKFFHKTCYYKHWVLHTYHYPFEKQQATNLQKITTAGNYRLVHTWVLYTCKQLIHTNIYIYIYYKIILQYISYTYLYYLIFTFVTSVKHSSSRLSWTGHRKFKHNFQWLFLVPLKGLTQPMDPEKKKELYFPY